MRWRVVLVATHGNGEFISRTVRHLREIGFEDGVHVFAAKGVTVPNSPEIIKQRLQGVDSEASLWVETLDTMGRVYSSTEDVFLVMSPGFQLWEHLRRYVNATIEPNFSAIYLPYAPQRFYSENEYRSLPCSTDQVGWCETQMSEPSEASRVLILHRHTMRLLSSYLRDFHSETGFLMGWPELLSDCVSRNQLICYAARPSFVVEPDDVTEDFVGKRQLTLDLRANMYLN